MKERPDRAKCPRRLALPNCYVPRPSGGFHPSPGSVLLPHRLSPTAGYYQNPPLSSDDFALYTVSCGDPVGCCRTAGGVKDRSMPDSTCGSGGGVSRRDYIDIIVPPPPGLLSLPLVPLAAPPPSPPTPITASITNSHRYPHPRHHLLLPSPYHGTPLLVKPALLRVSCPAREP